MWFVFIRGAYNEPESDLISRSDVCSLLNPFYEFATAGLTLLSQFIGMAFSASLTEQLLNVAAKQVSHALVI